MPGDSRLVIDVPLPTDSPDRRATLTAGQLGSDCEFDGKQRTWLLEPSEECEVNFLFARIIGVRNA